MQRLGGNAKIQYCYLFFSTVAVVKHTCQYKFEFLFLRIRYCILLHSPHLNRAKNGLKCGKNKRCLVVTS
jgi:hypothetical protein